MATTNIPMAQTQTRAKRLGICLIVALSCATAPGQEPTATGVVGAMMENLTFPRNASMNLKVESRGTWHNAPAAEVAPYSGTLVDQWRTTSDAERYGRELLRESPAGRSQSRMVFHGSQRWTFEFDTGAPPDAAIAGRVVIRNRALRGSRWHMPIVDYFDRIFVFPGRSFDNYELLEADTTMVPIDGHPCHLVRGEWNGREFAFWLDPEFGYLPRQYTMRLLHSNEEYFGSRGAPGPVENRMLAPTEMQELLDNPIESEERLSSVDLQQVEDKYYIAAATLEKTRTYPGGVSHTEHLTFQCSDFSLAPASDANDFLSFAGLLRDGTPAEESVGGRFEPETIKYYEFKDGELAPARLGGGVYFRELWGNLKTLATDFSLENLRRLDSMILIGICAAAALLINGAMAYAAYRKKRAKGPAPE